MNHVGNSRSELFMEDDSFVAVLNSVMRYEVTYTAEYNLTTSHARVTDVVQNMSSSKYIPSRFRKSYLCYVRLARLCLQHDEPL